MNKQHKDLINNNIRLIHRIVNSAMKQMKIYPSREVSQYYDIRNELFSYACEIICEKIHEYDENKGKYYNFAYNVILPNLKNYYYRDLLVKSMTPFYDINEMKEDDCLVATDNDLEEKEDSFYMDICLNQAIDELDEYPAYLIRSSFFQRLSVIESHRRFNKNKSKEEKKGTNQSCSYHFDKGMTALKKKMRNYTKILNTIDKLCPEEQQIIKGVFFHKQTLENIEEKVGISNIEQRYTTALSNLNKLLEKKDG